MPKNLVEAFKLDLQNNFMVIMSSNNWSALCTHVLQTIYNSNNFSDKDFPVVTMYVKSHSKNEIVREIESYAVHPERMLGNYGMISKSASNGIIYNVFKEMLNDAVNETLDKHNIFDPVVRKRNIDYIYNQLKLGNFNVITGTKREMIKVIFENDEPINKVSNGRIKPSIKEIICRKIDMINVNNSFKEHLKKQVSDETISREELERYRTITPEEIDEYFSLINGYGSNNGSGLSM